jgi:serine/threonine kinase 32
MSYYPHNQPIVAIGPDSDGTERTYSQSVTGTLVTGVNGTIVDRSLAGSPPLDGETTYQGHHQRNPTLRSASIDRRIQA